jgi:Cu-Zn family superoxide dismutase
MAYRLSLVSALIVGMFTAGAALAADATASFKSGAGVDLGAATLAEGPSGVLVRLDLKGLKPGWHAVHFHAKGDCSDAAFQSAGAHINHAAMPHPHGLLNPQGPDFGDLPNVFATADGTAKAEVFSSLVSFSGQGGRAALRDADGSSIVVHENPDDYTSQPIGGAGARVACAAVK